MKISIFFNNTCPKIDLLVAIHVDAEEFFESQVKVADDINDTGMLDCIVRVKQPTDVTTIQMDNAPAHTGKENIDNLNEHCEDHDLRIEYTTQPSQSPDFNILDLCLFHSLAKRVDRLKHVSDKDLISLWEAVKQVWAEYDRETIEIAYGHLYANYNECLRHNGGNWYKNPHASVRVLHGRGEPLNRCCLSYEEYVVLYRETTEWLRNNN